MKNASRYDDPEFQKQVSLQMLGTPTLEIACRAITDLRGELQHERTYIDDLLQRIKDLEYLYAVVTGPAGDGGNYNYLMQQLEIRFAMGVLQDRDRAQVDRYLHEIDKAVDAMKELQQAKMQLLNVFTGGKLFPGERK